MANTVSTPSVIAKEALMLLDNMLVMGNLVHRGYEAEVQKEVNVYKKGGKVRLTEKETSILKYLYRAGEKVISREVLLHEVWGYNAGVTTHTLETHIYRLRQKIERDPSKAELLITESGGYKLIP